MRRSRIEVDMVRNRVRAEKDTVIARYRDGESMASLGKEYGVGSTWLTQQFIEWDEPRRDRAAAAQQRGPGIPPLPR